MALDSHYWKIPVFKEKEITIDEKTKAIKKYSLNPVFNNIAIVIAVTTAL